MHGSSASGNVIQGNIVGTDAGGTIDLGNDSTGIIFRNDGVHTTYTYNGDGDRVSQTVDTVTTTYVLDTAAPLTLVLAETTASDTIYYLHGLDLVAQSEAAPNYMLTEGLGSVRQLSDGAGIRIIGTKRSSMDN